MIPDPKRIPVEPKLEIADDETVVQSNRLFYALADIREQTSFLWRGLSELPSEANQMGCEIRETTLTRIQPNLAILAEAGCFAWESHFAYNNRQGQVMRLHLSQISPEFRKLILLVRPPVQDKK